MLYYTQRAHGERNPVWRGEKTCCAVLCWEAGMVMDEEVLGVSEGAGKDSKAQNLIDQVT